MSYHCPVCNKISVTSLDLARHVFGRGDKVHRDWMNSKGLKYAELLAMQFCNSSRLVMRVIKL